MKNHFNQQTANRQAAQTHLDEWQQADLNYEFVGFSQASGKSVLRDLVQLQGRINAGSAEKAVNGVTVIRVKPTQTRNGNPAFLAHAQDNPTGSGRVHQVSISSRNSQSPLQTQQPLVTCTCEDFKYRCEYALAYRGYSIILHSNGEPPVIKNPRLSPFLCKHIIAVANALFHR